MIRVERLNQVLIGLFGFSLCVFKGGLYIFPALLLVSLLVFNAKDMFQDKSIRNVLIISVVTYTIGLLSQFVNMEYYSDVSFFSKKAAFLLLIPLLLYYLKDHINQRVLLFSFIAGLIAANIYCYYLFNYYGFSMSESLVDSFWDILRWRDILSFSICAFIPLLFHRSNKIKMLFLVLIISCIPSVIFSGGRVIYFSVGMSALFYFFLLKREKIKLLIGISVVMLFIGVMVKNPVSTAIETRVTSMFNTESDYSNLGRLSMYKEGVIFIHDQLVTNPELIIFGMGERGFHDKYLRYLKENKKYDALMVSTNRQFSFKDQHNAFLNTLSKRGMIYFILFYTLFSYIFYQTYKDAKKENVYAQSALMLLMCFMFVGLVYGNAFSFETIIVFTMWSLFYSMRGEYESVSNECDGVSKDIL